MDKASDQLHDSAIKQEEEIPDVVHLAHLTTPEWWLCLMRPVTAWSMILTWVYGQTFIVEGNRFDKLKLQTRAIPKYSFQVNIKNFIHY